MLAAIEGREPVTLTAYIFDSDTGRGSRRPFGRRRAGVEYASWMASASGTEGRARASSERPRCGAPVQRRPSPLAVLISLHNHRKYSSSTGSASGGMNLNRHRPRGRKSIGRGPALWDQGAHIVAGS
jgi:hypothetical protein